MIVVKSILLFAVTVSVVNALNVIYAVNCGGQEHIDINGVRYQRDPLSVGVASDYGKNLPISRVVPQDQILYQTERYHTSSFSYDLPIPGDGDYVLILKFSEVWFANPNQKVFDVLLNNDHAIVTGLDIFGKVGRGAAHDEVIPFRVKGDRLFVGSDASQFYNRVPVEFVKGERDNPKVNAIVLLKGSIDEVPRLPPLPGGGQPPVDGGDLDQPLPDAAHDPAPPASAEEDEAARRKRKVSGPKVSDPYQADPASTALLPVLIAVAAALPLFFCLCKL